LWFDALGASVQKYLVTAIGLLMVAATSGAHAREVGVACVQEQLNILGFETGTPDGVLGGKTRAASEAYQSASPALSGLPKLTPETAKVWCDTLAKTSPELAAIALGGPDDVLVAGPGVSTRQEKAILDGLVEAHGLVKRRLGLTLERPVTAFASDDAKWLTDNYLKARNLGENYRNGKMQEFGSCEPAAEGAYYNMFLCMGSNAWTRSTMPSGSRDAEVMSIVMHEYMHNVQFGLVGERGKSCCTDSNAMSIFGPQWLVEGSAEYMRYVLMDELGHMDLSRYIKDIGKQVRGGDLNLLARETRKGFRESENSWPMGTLATHYLVSLSDFPSLARFWQQIGTGGDMRAAFSSSFGMSTEAFALDFAKWANPKISAGQLADISAPADTSTSATPAPKPKAQASAVDNMACVQKQFRVLGYYKGDVDGLMNDDMREGSKRYIAYMKKNNPGWNSPVLDAGNAGEWCQHVAGANPQVAEYWVALQ
jgi:hypothetical protein